MDRRSNLEVNDLLQRMAGFGGICILTTNHDRVLDEAFRRRLASASRSPRPTRRSASCCGASCSRRCRTTPASTSPAWRNRFDVAGGNIKNAVIRSAVLAIADGSQVSPPPPRRRDPRARRDRPRGGGASTRS